MKKLNQQGFTHHLLILGIAIVVVAAVGFTGYRVYTSKNNDRAKAAGWSNMYWRGNPINFAVKGCKSSAYAGKAYAVNYTDLTFTVRANNINYTVRPHTNSSAFPIGFPSTVYVTFSGGGGTGSTDSVTATC